MAGADILLVEDERWLGDVYERCLVRSGRKVHRSDDAQAALDVLDNHPEIGLVFVDLLLPGHNGFSFLFEVVSHTDWQDKRFVVMSSLPAEEVVDDPSMWGHLNVCGYIYKPRFDPLSLPQYVEYALA
jgi:DNA-binding response OmpR family regulator